LTSEPSEYEKKSAKKKARDPEIEELKLKRRLKRRLRDLDTKPDKVLIRIEQNLIEVNERLKEIIRLLNTKCLRSENNN
jgi:chromatin segregation and condensation protein Rec8/ScpA/Scc1 (kleisin family)